MNPHPGVVQPEAVESDYQMTDGLIVLDMPKALSGYSLRSCSVDCTSTISYLLNKNHQKKNVFSNLIFEISQFLERTKFTSIFSKNLGIQI